MAQGHECVLNETVFEK